MGKYMCFLVSDGRHEMFSCHLCVDGTMALFGNKNLIAWVAFCISWIGSAMSTRLRCSRKWFVTPLSTTIDFFALLVCGYGRLLA